MRAQNRLQHPWCTLECGWDTQRGGFYEKGFYDDGSCAIISDAKIWRAHFEVLPALLLMSVLVPGQASLYTERILQLWRYIWSYILCSDHRSCYWAGTDTRPKEKVENSVPHRTGPYRSNPVAARYRSHESGP